MYFHIIFIIKKAHKSLSQIYTNPNKVYSELTEIRLISNHQGIENEKNYKTQLFVAVCIFRIFHFLKGLAIFQQATGINAILSYSDEIMISWGASASRNTTALIGVVSFLFTFIAMGFVERIFNNTFHKIIEFGRKCLFIIGTILCAISMILFAVFFEKNAAAQIVFLMIFNAAFVFSHGAIWYFPILYETIVGCIVQKFYLQIYYRIQML